MTAIAFYTSGDIARILDVKVQAVRHILHTRRHIRECQRAGIVKLYDYAALEAVRAELANQRARETGISSDPGGAPS